MLTLMSLITLGLLTGLAAVRLVSAVAALARGELPMGRSLEVVPAWLGGPAVPPGRRSLATELRLRRSRLFCIRACDAQGRARNMIIDALNPAAAELKARTWGLHVREINAAVAPPEAADY